MEMFSKFMIRTFLSNRKRFEGDSSGFLVWINSFFCKSRQPHHESYMNILVMAHDTMVFLEFTFMVRHCTTNKVFIKDFFSKCDQIHRKLQIWSHLLKKSFMENAIFGAVRFLHTGHIQSTNHKIVIAWFSEVFRLFFRLDGLCKHCSYSSSQRFFFVRATHNVNPVSSLSWLALFCGIHFLT